MTVIAAESFMQIYPELLPLFELHWKELALYKDKMPLYPRLAAYDALERLGELITLTARQNGELVGYFVVHYGPGMHYAGTLTAHTDLPYVHPEIRGRGIGVRLFLRGQDEMKKRGVQMWQSGLKINSALQPSMHKLLTWMDMTPTDLIYSKWIGA